MTDKKLKELKKDAQETIENINLSKDLTKQEFLLLGASLSVLNHNNQQPTMIINDKQDPLPESNINEDIDDLNSATIKFWRSVDKFELMRTQQAKDEMVDNLKSLLEVWESIIVELRHKIHFPECVEMLKQFYYNISNRI